MNTYSLSEQLCHFERHAKSLTEKIDTRSAELEALRKDLCSRCPPLPSPSHPSSVCPTRPLVPLTLLLLLLLLLLLTLLLFHFPLVRPLPLTSPRCEILGDDLDDTFHDVATDLSQVCIPHSRLTNRPTDRLSN